MFERSFIDGCLYGATDLDELDDYVDFWHENDTGNTLREFLGMSPFEYAEWLKLGDIVIRDILRCRKDKISYESYQYMSSDQRIAARSYSVDEIEALKNDDKHGDQ